MFTLYFLLSRIPLIHSCRDRVGVVLMSRLKNLAFSSYIFLILLKRWMEAMLRRFWVMEMNLRPFLLWLELTLDAVFFSISHSLSTNSLLSFWMFYSMLLFNYLFFDWIPHWDSSLSIIYYDHQSCFLPSQPLLSASCEPPFSNECPDVLWSF